MRNTFKYWFKVILPKAFSRAFEWLGFRGVILELAVSAVADYLSSGNIGLMTFLIWGGLLLITLIAFILREPARTYEEQGGFIEIPFAIKAHPPYPKNPGESRWASIDIINISHFPIEKCYVELNSANDAKNKFSLDMPRNLRWSWGHGEQNRTRELDLLQTPLVCDIAVSSPKHNLIVFETWAGQQANITGKGIYNLVITVHGLWKGQLVKRSFELVLEYKGGNIITVIEKGSPKWEEVNPKPRAIKIGKTKALPDSKSPSS
jgi:hypothetical protein